MGGAQRDETVDHASDHRRRLAEKTQGDRITLVGMGDDQWRLRAIIARRRGPGPEDGRRRIVVETGEERVGQVGARRETVMGEDRSPQPRTPQNRARTFV
ncbi:MAG: hypothetical protein ACK559_00390, partial [bacterium]